MSLSNCSITIFLWLALLCVVAQSIPLRSLFIRSYDDMNQETLPHIYISAASAAGNAGNSDSEAYGDAENENRPKRGLDLLKRRVEIIERNRCFFNPITCY